MKEGKISDSVLKRTILRSIGSPVDGVEKPKAGRDASVIHMTSKPQAEVSTFSITTATAVGQDRIDMKIAIATAANNLAVRGYYPKAFVIALTLPEDMEESTLRELMEEAEAETKSYGGSIAGGHTEVSSRVEEAVINITATGYEKMSETVDLELTNIKSKIAEAAEIRQNKEASESETGEAESGLDIVMTGFAGCEGAGRIYEWCREELEPLFSANYLKSATDALEHLSVAREAAVAVKHGVLAMHDIHNGGVFGALWELSMQLQTGISVDIRKIPIKQQTIEICEKLDINPYELSSVGALLLVTEDGESLVEALEAEGIRADIIGKVTADNEKTLLNNGEIRFLDKPKSDEIYKINRNERKG